jgi:hypothetical protein
LTLICYFQVFENPLIYPFVSDNYRYDWVLVWFSSLNISFTKIELWVYCFNCTNCIYVQLWFLFIKK